MTKNLGKKCPLPRDSWLRFTPNLNSDEFTNWLLSKEFEKWRMNREQLKELLSEERIFIQWTDADRVAWLHEFTSKELTSKKGGPRVGYVVSAPPGHFVNWLIELLATKKAYERVFQPVISDMREEYFSALSEGRLRKARWILICGHCAFVLTIFAHLGSSIAKKIVTLWRAAG